MSPLDECDISINQRKADAPTEQQVGVRLRNYLGGSRFAESGSMELTKPPKFKIVSAHIDCNDYFSGDRASFVASVTDFFRCYRPRPRRLHLRQRPYLG